ncbi:MAG TPA: hypothetical protein VEW74_00625 [Candidatus Nitrosotalea sp.]|nr:hypothetical protein [Candidatus Nitrosotalea sp.]
MSESFRTPPPDQPWATSNTGGNGYQSGADRPGPDESDSGDAGRVVLVGVLGGLLSAAAYMIYRRLPDEQKERLNSQVRQAVQQRITEIRQNFNI